MLRKLFTTKALSLALVLLALVGAPHRSLSAQTVDVIRGRVTGPENQPLEGVDVGVTTLSGAVTRSARTDRNGRYMVTFPGGDGDYFVTFRQLGYAPKRFEIKRVADEEILVADAKLERANAQTLNRVEVTAPRNRVGRNDNNQDISGTERVLNPSALSPNQLGELAALAASIPGVLYVPGQDGDPSGYSVLGLSPDQNNTSLNGQNTGLGDLPRDAAVSASLSTSPYDVSRGGFSGGNLNIRTRSGTNFKLRAASLNVDAPGMQWTDATARALGQEYTNLSLGGNVSGPIRYNHSYYNTSYQIGRRSNDYQNLLNTSALGLEASGISSDSVTRLLGILGGLGIPAQVRGTPTERLNDQLSLLGAFDLAPPSSRAGSALSLTLNGNVNKANPLSFQSTELPAHSGERTSWAGGAQLRHSGYYGVLLSETALSISGNRIELEPYLSLPGGIVRVNSSFPNGQNTVRNIQFGGNAPLQSTNATSGINLSNQLSWFSANNKHRIKLTSEIRRDAYEIDQSGNLLGTFVFNSLADLQAGRPSQFTRTLQPRLRSSDQVTGSIALGDAYRVSSTFQLQYGVRIDANAFGDRPTRNAKVEQVFGVRNDEVPNGMYVSPRVGFSWTYGSAPQIGGFEGAFRGPRNVVRGGIGVFQGLPGTQLTSAALDNTGLPNALQQLNCTGIAVPTPQWSSYLASTGSIPAECADGTNGTVFASALPNVSMIAKDYAPPRSIRSNLQWNGPVLGNRLSLQLEGTFSLNMNQQGFVDRNFQPTQRFTLASEDGRPVYVAPGSIDPLTGFIAARDARVSQEFNRVTEQRSDLRSLSRQLRATFSPATFSSTYSWNISYVYSNVRERVRGFGTNTAGNPLDVEWARSNFDSRHQFQYTLFYNLFDVFRLNWFGNVRSGMPFTPTVAGDINGDGFANDRAFVYSAATATDPALASAMQSLLESSSGNVRRCLQKQLGTIAARNSCTGPWTHFANLSVSFNPLKVRMPQRATLSFAVSNPLGAADLLLHGSDNVRGWGQSPIPESSLLFLRGFDASTNRYKYDVNQRFGSTRPQNTTARTPVTLTAMMRFDLGPTRERQSLTQQLNVGRRVDGNKLPESTIKAIYGAGGLINPLSGILRQTDSLKLSVMQADSLATMNRWYLIRVDSIWSPIAKYLAGLPDRYDEDIAYGKYREGRRGTVDLLRRLAPSVKELLTPAQRRMLPAILASYLDPRYLAAVRNGTAGAGFPGAGGPLAIPGAAGGSTSVQIVR